MADEKSIFTYGDGFVDIQLRTGITVAGVKVSAVRMREPTVRDQRAMAKGEGTDADREVEFFANLCGILPTELNDMTGKDYSRLQKGFLGFPD